MLKYIPYWQFVFSKYTDGKEAESIIRYEKHQDLSNFLYKKRYVFYDQNGIDIYRIIYNNSWYVFFKQSTRLKEYRNSVHVNFFLFDEKELQKLNFINPYFFIDLLFKSNNPFKIETPTEVINRDNNLEMELDIRVIENAVLEKELPLKDFLVKLLLGNLDYDTIIASRGYIPEIHINLRRFCLVHKKLESNFSNTSDLLSIIVDVFTSENNLIQAYGKLLLDNITTGEFKNFTQELLYEAEIFNLLYNKKQPSTSNKDKINSYLKEQESNINYDQSFIKTKALYYRLSAIKYFDLPILERDLFFDTDLNSVIYELFKDKVKFDYSPSTINILLEANYLDDLVINNLPHNFKTTIAIHTLEKFNYDTENLDYNLFRGCYKYAHKYLSLDVLSKALKSIDIKERERFINDINIKQIEKQFVDFENNKVNLLEWLINILGYKIDLREIIEKAWIERLNRDSSCVDHIVELSKVFVRDNISSFTNVEYEDKYEFLKIFKDIISITNNTKINNVIKTELKKNINLELPKYNLKLQKSENIEVYNTALQDMTLYTFFNQVTNIENEKDNV